MYLFADKPAGASVGTHSFDISSENELISILYGRSIFSTDVSYNYSHWYIADSLKLPTTEIAQLMALLNKRLDEDNGLSITYGNGTDVNQASKRTIRLWVRKIKVA